MWGITSVLWGDNISTVEGIQYCGGYLAVVWRLFSTVGDNISTVGIAYVLWRIFSILGDNISHAGG